MRRRTFLQYLLTAIPAWYGAALCMKPAPPGLRQVDGWILRDDDLDPT